jgi:hypothetical protein
VAVGRANGSKITENNNMAREADTLFKTAAPPLTKTHPSRAREALIGAVGSKENDLGLVIGLAA